MADPLKAEDLSSELLTPASPEPPVLPGTPPTFRELPPARNRLTYTAGTLGNSVGTAVRRARRLPARLKVVGGRATRIEPVETSGGTVDEIKEAAQEHLQDWRDSSRRSIYQLRRQVHQLRNDYPVQTILAFGALGFVLGATLRVWRSR